MTAIARRRLAGVGAFVVWLYALLVVLTAPSAVAAEPEFVSGNPTCADVTDGGTELKIEGGGELQAGDSGTYSDGVLEVTLSIYSTVNGWEFDWSTNHGVDSVVVKGGPAANVYLYEPIATSDAGLHAPLNSGNQRWYGLSHISFCYFEENTTTTTEGSTTTTEESTTTTEASTTTTSQDTTTTTSGSTTTTDGTTTTSEETTTTVSVQGTVVTTAPEGAVPTVAGTVVTTAAVIAVDTLPFTGADGQAMVTLAVAVLAMGALLLSSVGQAEPVRGRHIRRWSDRNQDLGSWE